MTSPIDYDAVLADLEAKKAAVVAQFDAAINAIRLMTASVGGMGDGSEQLILDAPPGAAIPINPPRAGSSTVVSDSFFGLSTPDAVKKFLTMAKRPQRVNDIANALLQGGQVHARDFTTAYNNVYAAVKRMRKAGVAVRIKSGEWALAEWYGANKPKESD